MLSTLVTTFDKKAVTLGLANANVQGHTAYDIVKVASLIEAEAKVDADRPLIASVIYNRLARGMPLDIDATLIYARGDPRNRSLSDKDKLIVSPYNTYAHTGLPPTPIDCGQRGVAQGRARAGDVAVPLLRRDRQEGRHRVRDHVGATEREHRDREEERRVLTDHRQRRGSRA